ncbi:MAG: hypothetical protein IKT29_03800 [Flavobacteriales bacterium]|nr:hypothetical protein [Flavobacteriales bacterium]
MKKILSTYIKHFLLLLTIWSTAGVIYGQENNTIPIDSTDTYTPSLQGVSRHYDRMSRRSVRYSMDIGTHATWVGEGSNAWGMHINPEATFPIGDKWDITAGIDLHQTYYNGTAFIPWGMVNEDNGTYRGNNTDAILYIAASYYASRRLTVHGSAFINANGNSSNPYLPSKGVSLGADYRLGRKTWIGVNFSYIESNVPSIYPYGMPMSWYLPYGRLY